MSQENADQAEYWSADAGHKWVAHQHRLDACFQPVLDAVLERAALEPGQRVLDIGCGTGASTLQAAQMVGKGGLVHGADISPTMLAFARKRSRGITQAEFIEADAADHPFEPGFYDTMISRFGVMFFADPVIAFSNISKSLKRGSHLVFATWGQVPNNPWFTLPALAAKKILGAPPSVDPDAPGPFAFRNPQRVLEILDQAGLNDATCETSNIALSPEGTLADVADLAVSIGPAARTLDHFEGSKTDRDAVASEISALFAPLSTPDGIRVPAEINFFRARV